eukprot:TRINITY_DN5597_c0_g1_i2.p4 TRINITY_DN5597_c0_g1~~TRINITY_DN5597_c0_g1_i2.p4  ORF type:complete len:123 (+),score=1.69 TRINITY_DN5597_c0_g1_i2:114-482(+)
MPSMFQDVMGDLYFSQNQQINNAITLEIMYEIKILLVLIEDLTLMTQFEMTASFHNTIQFKSNQNTLYISLQTVKKQFLKRFRRKIKQNRTMLLNLQYKSKNNIKNSKQTIFWHFMQQILQI